MTVKNSSEHKKKDAKGAIYIWHSGMLPSRRWYLRKEISHTGF